MTIAYKRRKKAINSAIKTLGYPIPAIDFAYLQAHWQRKVDGLLLGTLQDILHARQGVVKTGADIT